MSVWTNGRRRRGREATSGSAFSTPSIGHAGAADSSSAWRTKINRRFSWPEGDSWFQYPVFLKDVIDHLAADHTIFCLSGAGDELRTMVANPEYRDYLDHLAGGKGIAFSAFLYSAGCNDVVAEHMRAFLKPYDAAQPAAWHLHPESLRGSWRISWPATRW